MWEKVSRKILQEIPAKSSKTYTTKIPDNFLQRGQASLSGYSFDLLLEREVGCQGWLVFLAVWFFWAGGLLCSKNRPLRS